MMNIRPEWMVDGMLCIPREVMRDASYAARQRYRRCDYCCNYGHDAGVCPHMARHLVHPSPKHNGLRAFAKLIDGR